MALRKVGALWKNDKGGKKYLSGSLSEAIPSGTKLLVFPNTYKKEDRHPDYTINVAEDDQPNRDDYRQAPPPTEEDPF